MLIRLAGETPYWLLLSGAATEGSGGSDDQGSADGNADSAAGGSSADGSADTGSGSSQSQGFADSQQGQDDGAKPEGQGDGDGKTEARAKPVDWRDRRISQLTGRLKEALENRAQPINNTGTAAATDGTATVPASEVDALANQRAQAIAAQNEFNRVCNEAAAAGRSTFGAAEFNARVQGLTQLVDATDAGSVASYNAFLAAAIETGEGPWLIHELGGDLDEAARIMALSPVKMGIELTKQALAKSGGAEATKAPNPVQALGNRGTSHEAIDPGDPDRADRLSTAEWMRRREAQANKAAA